MRPRRSSFRTAGALSVWAGAWLALVVGSTPLAANPADPQVIRGTVGFDDAVSGHLRVHQGSDRAVIDWGAFSIAPGEVTQFIQPGVRSAVLNRVRGNGASLLEGTLTANGNVFLLNPNGIVLGRSGRVDAAGFVASTLDVDDDAFWNGGDLEFRGDSSAAVVNLGQIEAGDGDVFLIGAAVRNEGFIRAPKGTVGLAAGNDVLLKAAGTGDERVFVRGASGGTKAVGVENRGVIEANQAELKAHGGNVYALAVRNEGRIAATGVTKSGGRILLRANGGRIESVGTVRARRSGGVGGAIRVDAGAGPESRVEVSGGSLDASADTGKGGTVEITAAGTRIGADAALRADGADGGSGGTVEVIAEDRLEFDGVVSARGSVSGGDGGFVELSGRNELFVQDLVRQVDVGAPAGRAGTLFLDPIDIAILDGTAPGVSGTVIYDGAIVDWLATGGLTIGTSPGSGGNGDITVDGAADVSWSTGHDLTLLADRDFRMNPGARIASSGAGSFAVTAARGIEIGAGALLSTAAGDLELSANQQAVPTAGTFDGVRIDGGTVRSTGSGNVTVLGKGGSAGTSPGVRLQNAGQILGGTSGLVTVTGTGNTVAAGNGVTLSGAGTRIGSAGADVVVNGTASGTNARGVFLGDGAEIGALGAGDVTVTGNGAPAGGFSEGIFLNGAVGAVSVSAAGGNVLLHGTGGGDGAGGNNQGVRIDGGSSSVFAGGTGTLEVTGFGGTAGTGNQNEGVVVVNASLGTAGGAITVAGTGGGAGASTGNAGVRIGGTTGTVSSGGLLAITGTGGANAATSGIDLGSPVGVSGDGVTLVADGMHLGSTTMVDAGAGIAELRPLTDGLAVDLGGADVAGVALGLTDAELDRVTAGLVRIGNGGAGPITVSNAVTHGNHLALISGAGVSLNHSVTMAADRNLAVTALGTGNGTISVGAALAATGTGMISLTTPRNITFATGASATTGDGNLTLEANAAGTTSGHFQGVHVGNAASLASGTGTISVTGRGGDTVDAGNHGIQIDDTATIGSSGGDIFLTGQARGGTGASPTQEGLIIRGSVTAGHSGNITLSGTGGNGTSGNLGVHLFGGVLVSTESGDISITGVSGQGSNSPGIQVADFGGPAPARITSTSGTITLHGDGSAGSSPGINAFGSGVEIGGGTGDVVLEAVGDLSLGSGAQIGATGAGLVSLTASRRLSLGAGVGVAATDGGVTLLANQFAPLSADPSAGIAIDGASVTSGDGHILMAGLGGAFAGSGGHRGLWIRGGSLVEATGSGDVILSGIGGEGTDDNVGAEITGTGTVVRTSSGRLYVEGFGAAAGTGTGNDGVRIGPGAVFESVAGGNVELNGAAGGGTGALAIRGDIGTGRIAGTGLMMVTSNGGGVSLGQTVRAEELLLRAQAAGAGFELGGAANDVGTLAVGGDVALGSLDFRDMNGFTVGMVGTANGVQAEGDVVLTGGGSGTVTVAEAVGSESGRVEISGWDVTVAADVGTGAESDGGIGFKAGRSFALGAGIEVAPGGGGSVGIEAGRSIHLGSGSAIRTDGGGILLDANGLGIPWTGGFTGIELAGATVESSTGDVEVSGAGGTDAGMPGQAGIRVGAGSRIETGGNGRVDLTGTGGAGSGGSIGVEILGPGTEIRTGAGNLEIVGTGAAAALGSGNDGVRIGAGAVIESVAGGNVELDGKAGGGTGALAIRGEDGTGRVAGNGRVTLLSRGGDVDVAGVIRVGRLRLRDETGADSAAFRLLNPGNEVDVLTATGDGPLGAVGSVEMRDADELVLGANFGEAGTGIDVAGELKVSAPDRLTVDWDTLAGGGIRLVSNDLRIQAPLTSTGGRVTGLVDDLGSGTGGTITVDAPVGGALGVLLGGGPGTGNDGFIVNLPLEAGTTVSGNGGTDLLDFRGAFDPVDLDLGLVTLTDVEAVLGTPGADRVIGPTSGSAFVLTGRDVFRWGNTRFVGFENLSGGAGDDVFAVATGGRLSGTLDGGGGRNGVTYSGHQGPVTVDLGRGSATGIVSFASIQAFHGSLQSRDILLGTASGDTFAILANNAGEVGGTAFFSFENLRGGAGNDVFLFRNQATVAGAVDGQDGQADTLVIDDSNLAGPQTYEITSNSVSRNPVYRFVGLEGLVIVSGSGGDEFRTRFQPFTQYYSGGAGNDVLRVADAAATASPLVQPPSGDIGFVGIEDVVAGAAVGANSGQILQTEASEISANPGVGGGGSGDLAVTDRFSGGAGGTGGLVTLAAGIGAAALGGTVGGNAALPGAVGVLFASDRVTAANSWDLSGAVSLSGGAITVQGLEEIARQVSFNAEMELNAAAGGQPKATAGQGDGAVSVSGDGPVDPETGTGLSQGMALEAEGELLGALGQNLVIDLGDGPVGMGDLLPPGDPGILGALTSQSGPAAYSGLSQAIGGDGTAPAGPGDGAVDLGLAGGNPGASGTQGLQQNSDALTKNELEGALNGL